MPRTLISFALLVGRCMMPWTSLSACVGDQQTLCLHEILLLQLLRRWQLLWRWQLAAAGSASNFGRGDRHVGMLRSAASKTARQQDRLARLTISSMRASWEAVRCVILPPSLPGLSVGNTSSSACL